MRTLLHLATALLLTEATASYAQITNPDTLVAPPPRNPALHHQRAETNDLQWLWQYTNPSDKQTLLADARFTALLKDNLKAPQAMWGIGTPLNEVAQTFLAGEGTIASADNRHLTVTGCVVDHCPQRGMLYVDLGERNPLIIFFALRWNEQTRTTDEPNAPFTLWLFTSREIEAHALPQPIKDTISTFAGSGSCNTQKITSTIVVDPSGVPHVIGALESGIHLADCTSTQGTHS
jgi:hypothetical protein